MIKGSTNKRDTRAERDRMSLSEAWEAYRIDVIHFKNQSYKTEESHSIVGRSLVKYFGDIDMSELTFEKIRLWKIELEKKRCTGTVVLYIIRLRVVLDYLNIIGESAINPSRVPVPKRKETIPEYLSSKEVSNLIDCTTSLQAKTIISLLYSSGLRVSELCSLNRNTIKDDTFTVLGKGGFTRICFVDTRTHQLVKIHLEKRIDNNPALFVNRITKTRCTPSNVQEIFRNLRKKTGIENIHPHTLRHSFATNLLQSNCNLYHVQKMMGHKSLQTTQTYLHVADFDLEKAYFEHHST